MGSQAPQLEARGIVKRFGRHTVLSGVDLTVRRGEAVALIGENGAGKSTLTKILAGAERPDEGQILLEGRVAELRSPRRALQAGVAFIPQELAAVSQMTVAENVLLGQWPHYGPHLTSPGAIVRRARREAERFGIEIDVAQRMGRLRLADRQLAEILKALVRRAAVILLDEPTSALTEQESTALFAVLRRLRGEGAAILYISHRLDETFAFADRVVVLRNGRVVLSTATSATSREELVTSMLGEALLADERRTAATRAPRPGAPPVLRLSHWSRPGQPHLEDVELTASEGEVLGIFGVRGSGVELLADGLGGRRPRDLTGTLVLDGRPRRIFRSPGEAWRAGIAYVPPERKVDGLVLSQSAQVNLMLATFRRTARWGLLSHRRERKLAGELVERFDVRAQGLGQRVGELSGGNQQKVLLASRFAARPRVLVLHEPTRGVDVGARAQIHALLRQAAAERMAIVAATSDLEEAVLLSDRLLVMRDGRIVAQLTGEELTQEHALHLATWRAA